MKKTVTIVVGIYALIIVGSIIYFGFLQQFGVGGLTFNIAGKDEVLNPIDILIIATTIVSLFLLVISLIAFQRTKDTRILIVSMAFFFFAVKQFLFIFDNFFPQEYIYIDNAERTLELLILISFAMLLYGTHSRKAKKRRKRKKRSK